MYLYVCIYIYTHIIICYLIAGGCGEQELLERYHAVVEACMYVCMYVCMYICIYIYIYTYIYMFRERERENV